MDLNALDLAYLVVYNATQLFIWCIVFLRCSISLRHPLDAFQSSVTWVRLGQRLALLEPIHTVLGYSHGSLGPVLIQLAGRNFALFYAIERFTAPQERYAGPLFWVWSAIEVIRFPFYIVSVLKENEPPAILSWLRYTAFIPLYPIGMVLELLCYYAAIPQLGDGSRIQFVDGRFGLYFEMSRFLQSLVVIYLILGPLQYMYMLRQRSKKLAPSSLVNGRIS